MMTPCKKNDLMRNPLITGSTYVLIRIITVGLIPAAVIELLKYVDVQIPIWLRVINGYNSNIQNIVVFYVNYIY